jgi:hypothetical protein
MEGGGREKQGGAICINKLLEGGAIKFFQGICINKHLKEFALISMVSIWL